MPVGPFGLHHGQRAPEHSPPRLYDLKPDARDCSHPCRPFYPNFHASAGPKDTPAPALLSHQSTPRDTRLPSASVRPPLPGQQTSPPSATMAGTPGAPLSPDAGPTDPHLPKLPSGWIAQWDSRCVTPRRRSERRSIPQSSGRPHDEPIRPPSALRNLAAPPLTLAILAALASTTTSR